MNKAQSPIEINGRQFWRPFIQLSSGVVSYGAKGVGLHFFQRINYELVTFVFVAVEPTTICHTVHSVDLLHGHIWAARFQTNDVTYP